MKSNKWVGAGVLFAAGFLASVRAGQFYEEVRGSLSMYESYVSLPACYCVQEADCFAVGGAGFVYNYGPLGNYEIAPPQSPLYVTGDISAADYYVFLYIDQPASTPSYSLIDCEW